MVHKMTPEFLAEFEPPFIHETNRYNLRNANDIQSIHARTALFHNSFIPATVRDWNKLPLQVRQSESLSIFKKHLFADVSPWPDYFNAGSRVGQVLHTRLRLECSTLNNDLYRRNLAHYVSVGKLKMRLTTSSNVHFSINTDNNTCLTS